MNRDGMGQLVESVVSEGSDSDMLRAEEELVVQDGSGMGGASSDSAGEEDESQPASNAGDSQDPPAGRVGLHPDMEDLLNMCESGEYEVSEPTTFCTNCTAPMVPSDDMCEDCGHARSSDGMLFASEAAAASSAGGTYGSGSRDTRVALLYDERMELHEEGNATPHPERPDRIRAVMAKLLASGLAGQCRRVECRKATFPELAAVHTPDLIHLVEEASNQAAAHPDAGVAITSDTYVNAYTHVCARLAAGGAAEVAGLVARGEAPHAAAIVRPPGHHAESGMAMGFCFFNNAAVAARAAQAAGARRVIILDWDIHHGNGTQHIFEHDPSVLYISLHRYDHGQFYPGTGGASEVGYGKGEGFTLNVPWDAADMQNGDYLAAFSQVIVPVAYEFNPDLIVVSAGFDAADGDPIGQCRVTPEGFAHMTAMLKPVAPLVLLLEGGYNLQSTAESTDACLRVLLGEAPGSLPGPRVPSAYGCRGIQQAIRVQGRYWLSLRAVSELQQPAPAEALLKGLDSSSGGGTHAGSRGDREQPHASDAQPSDTQQLKRSSSIDASLAGRAGAGDVTSAKANAHHPPRAHLGGVGARRGRRSSAPAPPFRSHVLLAIHKRAMRAFWKRQRRMHAPAS